MNIVPSCLYKGYVEGFAGGVLLGEVYTLLRKIRFGAHPLSVEEEISSLDVFLKRASVVAVVAVMRGVGGVN